MAIDLTLKGNALFAICMTHSPIGCTDAKDVLVGDNQLSNQFKNVKLNCSNFLANIQGETSRLKISCGTVALYGPFY
jgi:hypothetical protein